MRRNTRSLASLALAFTLAACGGGGGYDAGGGANPPAPMPQPTAVTGTLKLSLTDAPSCGFEQVNVTVERLRIHQDANAADGDVGWSELVLTPARRINLLTLSNGVLLELGQLPLTVGHYAQLRLVLAANSANAPLANSVLPLGGAEQALTTPSGTQSGIKLSANIDIAANQMADFVLDFDACRSIVSAGNAGKTLLKPVVKLLPAYQSGVSGYVDLAQALGSTHISLQQDGQIVKATAPDASGRYVLSPVAPGSYQLVVTAPNRGVAVLTGVVVNSGAITALGTTGQTLGLSSSQSATLSGTLSTGASPVDGELRVLQTLSSGIRIQIAGSAVDSVTGAYSYTVPISAPTVGLYAAGSTNLPSFTLDGPVAGRYSLEALSGSAVKTASLAPLGSAGAVISTNFSFP